MRRPLFSACVFYIACLYLCVRVSAPALPSFESIDRQVIEVTVRVRAI